jgi:hypothetical protein
MLSGRVVRQNDPTERITVLVGRIQTPESKIVELYRPLGSPSDQHNLGTSRTAATVSGPKKADAKSSHPSRTPSAGKAHRRRPRGPLQPGGGQAPPARQHPIAPRWTLDGTFGRACFALASPVLLAREGNAMVLCLCCSCAVPVLFAGTGLLLGPRFETSDDSTAALLPRSPSSSPTV